MQQTFARGEKLKSRKQIQELFRKGRSLHSYPLLLIYINNRSQERPFPVQAGFSVSKRKFKKAVDRNLVKRRMREAYRLNKRNLQTISGADLMFIYTAGSILDYRDIEGAVIKLLHQLKNSVHPQSN